MSLHIYHGSKLLYLDIGTIKIIQYLWPCPCTAASTTVDLGPEGEDNICWKERRWEESMLYEQKKKR